MDVSLRRNECTGFIEQWIYRCLIISFGFYLRLIAWPVDAIRLNWTVNELPGISIDFHIVPLLGFESAWTSKSIDDYGSRDQRCALIPLFGTRQGQRLDITSLKVETIRLSAFIALWRSVPKDSNDEPESIPKSTHSQAKCNAVANETCLKRIF